MVIFRNIHFENFSCTLFLWKRRGKKFKYFWPAKNRPQEARISCSLAEVMAVFMQINNNHFGAGPPFFVPVWDIFREFRGLWAHKSKNMPYVLHNSCRKCIWFHVKLQINICAIYRFAPCHLNCHFSSFADLAIFRVLLSTSCEFNISSFKKSLRCQIISTASPKEKTQREWEKNRVILIFTSNRMWFLTSLKVLWWKF